MLASNNGDPRQCAANLLKLTRGENPYDRIKGIDAAITDAPSASARYDAIAEAEWVLDTYEPRVEVEGIDFEAPDAQGGDFSTITQIKLREEEDELQFIETDAGQIYDFIMYVLENGVTEELYPGDERRIFGETLATLVVALYSTMNDSAKQSTLRYARGDVLDALGEFAGVFRIEALPATTTVRFSLKEAVTQNIIITKGTRVTSDYSRYFKTTETTVLQAGSLYVDAEVESEEGGTTYNDIPVGEINVLVDMIPFIDGVSNTEETAGGGDEENDEDLRERIRLAPASRSTAGPKNSYKYYAVSADATVADAHVSSPSPGVVVITPILYGGEIPDQSVLDKVLAACNADDVRPLTDKVEVSAPTIQSYDIELKYYTTAANETAVVENIESSGGSIDQYIYWQGSSLDRNINPDYLRKLILCPEDSDGNHLTGADRVDIIKPVYTELSATTVAKFSGKLTVSHEVEG